MLTQSWDLNNSSLLPISALRTNTLLRKAKKTKNKKTKQEQRRNGTLLCLKVNSFYIKGFFIVNWALTKKTNMNPVCKYYSCRNWLCHRQCKTNQEGQWQSPPEIASCRRHGQPSHPRALPAVTSPLLHPAAVVGRQPSFNSSRPKYFTPNSMLLFILFSINQWYVLRSSIWYPRVIGFWGRLSDVSFGGACL